MMPSEHRGSDRTSYYTLKATGLAPSAAPTTNGHIRSGSQSYMTGKLTGMSQPSPAAHPQPPRLSPGVGWSMAPEARAPSPNYFGLAVDPTGDPRDSSLLPRNNWSPPPSSVKSFAAVIPFQLPLDVNPEFEAFKRQADLNRGKSGFNFAASNFPLGGGAPHLGLSSTSGLQRARLSRWQSNASDTPDGTPPRSDRFAVGNAGLAEAIDHKNDSFSDNLQDSAYVSADSKRNSSVSLNPPVFLGMGRTNSPGRPDAALVAAPGGRFGAAAAHPDVRKTTRMSSMAMADGIHAGAKAGGGVTDGANPSMMSPARLKNLLDEGKSGDVLLLDLRVSPQFAQARIRGALNLCIPTTLLKRATFNLQKLQQTFQEDQERNKFSNWRQVAHLVVYDASSSDKRDAISAMNMIKKFTNEGFSGSAEILAGGFITFAAAYPNMIDYSAREASPTLSLGAGPVADGPRTGVPPVIGGVLLPTAQNSPLPFFANIRQNQDLVDGVGQMDIGVPPNINRSILPRWLREAIEPSDHGKRVSDRFLKIELTEQARMKSAYSLFRSCDAERALDAGSVKLSGIEKGGKNRYKDILPFDHTRVKLQGRPEGSCDYVNASHIQASKSRKRYIASQAPLPATFEDFWSVVWDNDVRVIVMLTAESEGGQLKSHPYWKDREYGPLKLQAISEVKVSLEIDKQRPTVSGVTDPYSISAAQGGFPAHTSPEGGRRRANTTTTPGPAKAGASPQGGENGEAAYVIVRKFALSHSAHPFSPIREITQLHYPSWPDFGVPAQPSHLLALVELANVMQRASLPVNSPPTLDSQLVVPAMADVAAGSSTSQIRPGEGEMFGRRNNFEPPAWSTTPELDANARPMLVHCSAGCGRTGAFCTVDSVIDMLKSQRLQASGGQAQKTLPRDLGRDLDGDIAMNDGEARTIPEQSKSATGQDSNTIWSDIDGADLIVQTVEDFRKQRLSMVQSLRQFVLCYETVLEWIWQAQKGGVKGRCRSGSLAL